VKSGFGSGLIAAGCNLIPFILYVLQINPVLAGETPDIKAGYWRVAILMTIPNASGPSTGPAQFDRCVNPENVQSLLAMPRNAPCTMTKSNLKRDSLTWEMSCSQGGFNTVANGRMKFMGTRLEGEIKTIASGPQTIHITTNIEGRYLGPCVNLTRPEQERRPGRLKKFEE
jgi:hypothetical protein